MHTVHEDNPEAVLDALREFLGSEAGIMRSRTQKEVVMTDNQHILGERGKTLEDEFFRKEDARLTEKLRELKTKGPPAKSSPGSPASRTP